MDSVANLFPLSSPAVAPDGAATEAGEHPAPRQGVPAGAQAGRLRPGESLHHEEEGAHCQLYGK